MLSLLLFGCNPDNALNEIKVDPDPGEDTGEVVELLPGIEVDPGSLDFGVVCEEGFGSLRIRSIGEADLELTGLTASSGWDAGAYSLPLVLAPSEELSLVLTGAGTGQLLIESNAGEVVVPLSAEVEVPPALELQSPSSDQVLSMTDSTDFVALVVDGDEVEWASSVEGGLGVTPVTGNTAVYTWVPADHTAGTHTITAVATDACGSDSEEVQVCQQEGYTEGDIDLANWVTTGTAFWDTNNNRLQLTADTNSQAGTAFQTQSSIPADSVDIQFSFFAGSHDGADGISVTAIDLNRMTTYVGESGGGIGYMGLPGWSVEFDTYYNGWDTTSSDHVSFHTDGDVYTPQHTAVVPELEDNAWHEAHIVMDGNLLTVELDGTVILNAVTVTGATSFPAYVGFTGATGGATNLQLVDELTVTNYACEE